MEYIEKVPLPWIMETIYASAENIIEKSNKDNGTNLLGDLSSGWDDKRRFWWEKFYNFNCDELVVIQEFLAENSRLVP